MFAAHAAFRRGALATARRGITTSRTALGGADEPAYIHAKHMYDVGATKNRKLVFGLATFSVVFLGTAIPIYAINFQQSKTQG
ncbi:unnamed product [Ostreococcus tauri]|uniref:Unnamed product n=1 Tax=Ostreococcus tauri TaxID=70448 RepID=A0A090LXC7_OSTTA|nr:unnamed product [Ostreococcus tauri]CEF96550.1 unnamed product [Ostreococcus tauri]|eukprot:XP_022838155.1 unnamed product [Ostreococcus tauri]